MGRRRGAEIAAVLLLVVSVWSWRVPAIAEISKCRGVWTNKPCDEVEQTRLPETQRTPRPQEEIDLDRKKLLIQDLEIRILTARRDYEIEVGIESERALCLGKESSVVQCDEAVNKKRREIEERSLSAAKRKAAESVAQNVSEGKVEGEAEHRQIITIIQQPPELEEHRHPEHEKKRPKPMDADTTSAQSSSSSLVQPAAAAHSKASVNRQGAVGVLR